MPLRINVGLTKKVGLPQYGSAGASCNVELEVDAALLQNDLEGFYARVRSTYAACRQAVDEELARHQPPASQGNGQGNGHGGNGSVSGNGHGAPSNGRSGQNGSHRATGKQMDYIQKLAGQIKGLGVRRLESLAQRMYSKPMAELSSLDASGLIDCLRQIRSGALHLDAALSGASYEH